EVFLLNACDCSWDKVCEKIQTAKIHGGIVVISEMNLIDSQHLEGELNDILAGDAHPGFHLFATTNPPEYSGRKPLSPALKGRFRHLPIRQYSPAELQTIAEKVLPNNPQGKILAEKLTRKHCGLRADLKQKKVPLQPTSLDLQNVARAVIQGGDFTEEGLHQCLNQHYRLYLMAAKISLEELPESSALAMALNMRRGELDSGLCKWFNETVSGINRPWLIRQSYLNSINEKHHEIRIKAGLGGEEAKTQIIKMVAQAKWQASGLSLKPDQSDDTLTRALYRHWQQNWFDHKFGQTGVDANSVFSLTEEEKQTLATPACQPYLREADQQIEAWNANEAQLCPALWHQISDLPNHLIADFINEASAISGDDAPEPYNPEIQGEEAPALDQRTNYEDQDTPKVEFKRIFDKQNHSPAMDRWRAMDIYVTPEGAVKQIKLDDRHFQGVEALIPDPLPENLREMALTRDQTLATLEMSSKNGRYPLPSLTPHDSVVALRIKPNLPYKLIRDRYTGLHTLFISGAKADQSIQCTFIVEPRKPGEKTSAKKARPERSILFDVHCSEGVKNVLKELFANIGRHPSDKMKELLRTIKNTKDTRQRINAITEYCKQFSGEAEPEAQQNFFRFLVTRQQGSCRHRVPVFIAFCRYFGIPCRQMDSIVHSFAEYSADGGQTWESVDLGGAPGELTEITSELQSSGNVIDDCPMPGEIEEHVIKLLKDLMKIADLAQQQALAKVCGISLEELKKTVQTGIVLPITYWSIFSISTMVEKLWQEKDLAGFSLGVSILELQKTKALTSPNRNLVGTVRGTERDYRPMSEAVIQILSDSDEDRVIEPLKSLHSKMIEQAGVDTYEWLRSNVDILMKSNLARPSVIRFAREALLLGWLDPLPSSWSSIITAEQHHELLVRLQGVDELKVAATHCLKKWYTTLLSREKNSQQLQLIYERFQKEKMNAIFITHCHEGSSSFLEDQIVNRSIKNAWTDQPGGIPNVERMLVSQPAFPQLTSGKANHRPVIILGQPLWDSTMIKEKAEALFQRKLENSPELKKLSETIKSKPSLDLWYEKRTLNDLKNKCKQGILQAFSHYLYEMTHSKGGGLRYCWASAALGSNTFKRDYYGAHEPSSPEELYGMMTLIDSSSQFQKTVEDAYLREAQNASNALLLKSNELTKIAEEFINSVNLNSICDALDR
ncbi:transglutaminase domain-containing protein, partial [Endozoicomonas sp. ONNA1]|uniref:transglutaminase domain-containing protein n=1 Tax=Endozoicomonas sp. ONNA1 TaxID=2828740 RepID=UPI002147FFF0